MAEAYVMITSEVGEVRTVYSELEQNEEINGSIKQTNIVTGPFDIVALAQTEDLTSLTNNVVESIRDLDGVIDTNTVVVVE